jgi:hypothetical protein
MFKRKKKIKQAKIYLFRRLKKGLLLSREMRSERKPRKTTLKQ